MDKTQEKFLKLLKLLDGCRNKLLGTCNLFVTQYNHCKDVVKEELHQLYEQLLDCRDGIMQIDYVKKTSNGMIKKAEASSENLKKEYDDKVSFVETCMNDAETCRNTYRHEVGMCCKTYKMLRTDDIKKSIDKGYRQLVRSIKAILDKIDIVKENHSVLKNDINREKQEFYRLYSSLNEKFIKIG